MMFKKIEEVRSLLNKTASMEDLMETSFLLLSDKIEELKKLVTAEEDVSKED